MVIAMKSSASRPWYWLHWLTWLAVALVVGAIVLEQRQSRWVPLYGNTWKQTWHGWPSICLKLRTEFDIPPPSTPALAFDWQYPALAINTFFCLTLLLSTAFVVERWLRNPNRWQMSMAAALGWMLTLGILLATLNGNFEVSIAESQLMRRQRIDFHLLDWYSMRSPPRWPLLFGMACTIHTTGWLAWQASYCIVTRLHRQGEIDRQQ
jgi:hypothetical protein